jgi:general stress protein CsbA
MKRNLNRQYLRGSIICTVILLIAAVLNIVYGNNYISVIEFVAAFVIIGYIVNESRIRSKRKDLSTA